jgi:hypothetical protein
VPLYLPIASISVNVFLLLALGGGVGFLSGLFGVGGGFLMTPLLIFLGVPPAVAVSSQAPQIVASSVSGAIAHWRRGNVDLAMGLVLLVGGLAGSAAGVRAFAWLRTMGQVDLVISLLYVAMLGTVGSLMMAEALRALARREGAALRRKLHRHIWVHNLPLKWRFRRSRLYISLLPPFALGLLTGALVAVMGVGGGFVLVPAMIFLLGMPTMVAVGTSLFQIIFVTAAVTVLHSYANQTVDAVLALVLGIGGVTGAQWGTRIGTMLRAEQLRVLFAALVLLVAAKVGYDLFTPPVEPYSMTLLGG